MTGNPKPPLDEQWPEAPSADSRTKPPKSRPQAWKVVLFRVDTSLFLLSVALFLLWPDLDLSVSKWLYDEQGGGFLWRHEAWVVLIYQLTSVIGLLAVVVPLLLLLAGCVWRGHCLMPGRKSCLFLLAVALLGPGILVNLTLKQHWERPRPRQVIEFGGKRQFEPPFAPRFQCDSCRSFVSGHASVGFFFFSIALLLGKRRWLWLPVLAGGIIGLVRMLQGAHFLSDVVFSGWVLWFSSLLLYSLFFGRWSCFRADPADSD
jgi:lipid A 4'-phosphatase